MMEFVNGKDDIPYMKWKLKNAWNHQPDMIILWRKWSIKILEIANFKEYLEMSVILSINNLWWIIHGQTTNNDDTKVTF